MKTKGYTPEQIKNLVELLTENEVYHGYILLMFLKNKDTPVGSPIDICEDYRGILQRMNMFRWTKYIGNYPQKKNQEENESSAGYSIQDR